MFASLKNHDYRLLWFGQAGAAFAMNMQLVAQGWLVYEMTVSSINLALVTFAFTAPQIFFSLIGGVLADRVPKKPLLLVSQALNGVATLAMAVIILTGKVTFFDFVWVGFLNGTVLALSMPARTAFIPEIVSEGLMFNAMAFSMASWNIARIIGPAMAGLMIAVFAGGDKTSAFGVGMVYIVLSALYLGSSLTVLFMHHHGRPIGASRASPLRDVVAGLNYAASSPVVGGLILLSIVPFLFGMSVNTFLPAFNTDILAGGPDDLGLLMAAMGVGAVLGSLALAKMGDFRRKGTWLLATSALWGAMVAGFGYSTSMVWAMALVGLVGFVSAVNMSMNRSIVQLQVSPQMRGRVMSIDMMSHGLMPLGILPIGWVAENWGIDNGLGLSGALLIAGTALLWATLHGVRRIDLGFEKPGTAPGGQRQTMAARTDRVPATRAPEPATE